MSTPGLKFPPRAKRRENAMVTVLFIASLSSSFSEETQAPLLSTMYGFSILTKPLTCGNPSTQAPWSLRPGCTIRAPFANTAPPQVWSWSLVAAWPTKAAAMIRGGCAVTAMGDGTGCKLPTKMETKAPVNVSNTVLCFWGPWWSSREVNCLKRKNQQLRRALFTGRNLRYREQRVD